MKKCPKCGLMVSDSETECFDCGFSFPAVSDPGVITPPKSDNTARSRPR